MTSARIRPTVSVVVCTYTGGRWDELRAAVSSIEHQTCAALETIVVVDHDDALLARVKADLPGVVAIANAAARGLSGARNTGVASASGDVVAFLDDDAVAATDWLEQLSAEYRHDDVLGVGGAIVPVWDVRPRWFPPEFEWVVGCTYRGMPPARAAVRNLIGANMSFRSELLAEVGGFLTGVGRIGTRPLGCEETELCIRARRARPGGQFVYQPLARVAHHVPRRRAGWRYFVSRCYSEGLSKARVVREAGSAAGLSSERAYALRTLPRGVLSGVLATLTFRDPAGVARAVAIVVGLVTTASGFVAGRIARVAEPAQARSAGVGA
jgi:glycosyltransferase involved in cell wall biosynthesis